MPECSFCKKQYEVPRGTTFVLPSGELLYFCSSKCLKNNKLGRVGKKTKWAKNPKKTKEEKATKKETKPVEKKLVEKKDVEKKEGKK